MPPSTGNYSASYQLGRYSVRCESLKEYKTKAVSKPLFSVKDHNFWAEVKLVFPEERKTNLRRTYNAPDLLQVPLEQTQDTFRIVGMNSDSDVWPMICTNNTSFFSQMFRTKSLILVR